MELAASNTCDLLPNFHITWQFTFSSLKTFQALHSFPYTLSRLYILSLTHLPGLTFFPLHAFQAWRLVHALITQSCWGVLCEQPLKQTQSTEATLWARVLQITPCNRIVALGIYGTVKRTEPMRSSWIGGFHGEHYGGRFIFFDTLPCGLDYRCKSSEKSTASIFKAELSLFHRFRKWRLRYEIWGCQNVVLHIEVAGMSCCVNW